MVTPVSLLVNVGLKTLIENLNLIKMIKNSYCYFYFLPELLSPSIENNQGLLKPQKLKAKVASRLPFMQVENEQDRKGKGEREIRQRGGGRWREHTSRDWGQRTAEKGIKRRWRRN